MDSKWYAVYPAYVFSGQVSVAGYEKPSVTGGDPVAAIRRYVVAHERRMTEMVPTTCWRHKRAGKMFAVWQFEERAKVAVVRETIRREPVWRLFVMTGNEWDDLVPLCMPPDSPLQVRGLGGA